MDADVGVRETDMVFMKGKRAHCGFPEIAYGKYSEMLVAKGYRVARVEQMETPDMLKARNATLPKGRKVKVVSREMCSLLTPGTRTHDELSAAAAANDRADPVVSKMAESAKTPSLLMSAKQVDGETGGEFVC